MLAAREIKKSYSQKKVVRGVSLELNRGETVGLLGPNGAGKTTTFYMMVGLIPPDAGEILLGEEMITLTTLDERAHLGIAYLPQEASVFRELTVEENILCVLEQKSLRTAERREQMNQILKEFSIEHIRRSKGRELSGGERRRVEIARIMALRPHFMLLDEPFAGVDPIAVLELMEMINSLKKKGIGILITDHNVRETLKIVDKAYIMNKGEILVAGSPADIVQDETAKKFYLGEEFSI